MKKFNSNNISNFENIINKKKTYVGEMKIGPKIVPKRNQETC